MDTLNGAVAIISGASSGIGRATAGLFASEGSNVVLVSRTPEALKRVAEEIRGRGGECLVAPADVSDGDQVAGMVAATLETYGRIDVLVNNAGTLLEPTPLADLDETDWDRVFAVNAKGVYWTVKHVWPVMVEQSCGAIVNTASVIASRGVVDMAAYCASKAAVVMLTKVLALEGALHNIRVNCVSPGFIDTPMNDWLGSLQDDREIWLRDMVEQIPLQRAGEPEEIARAIRYLATSESSYMTGQVLVLDGGATI